MFWMYRRCSVVVRIIKIYCFYHYHHRITTALVVLVCLWFLPPCQKLGCHRFSAILCSNLARDALALAALAARLSFFSCKKQTSNAFFWTLHTPKNFWKEFSSWHNFRATITSWQDGCGRDRGGCIEPNRKSTTATVIVRVCRLAKVGMGQKPLRMAP